MAVIGPMVGYLVWKLACRAGIRRDVGVFLCAMLADLMTYFVTSAQLGGAFPDPATGAGEDAHKLGDRSACPGCRIGKGHPELDGGDKVGHQIRQHGAEKDPDIATDPRPTGTWAQ